LVFMGHIGGYIGTVNRSMAPRCWKSKEYLERIVAGKYTVSDNIEERYRAKDLLTLTTESQSAFRASLF
jgi:hypothetical protein